MNVKEAMYSRHSVRQYTNTFIDIKTVERLNKEIHKINRNENLHIQLIVDEPEAFQSQLARYGKFENVKNYFALVGPKNDPKLEEKLGYFGEQLVIKTQQLGLNTCWVGLTYKKNPSRVQIEENEKLVALIAIGYGQSQGIPHEQKPVEKICSNYNTVPKWFQNGIDLVLLAPTAVNQQRFTFSFEGNKVKARPGIGFFTKVDLGIAKYHFEVGAGSHNINWAK